MDLESMDLCLKIANEIKELEDFLEESFEPYLKTGKEESEFDWEFLKSFFRDCKDKFSCFYSLRIFCGFACKLFLRFNCEDNKLMTTVIFMYRELQSVYTKSFPCILCDKLIYPRRYHTVDYTSSELILEKADNVPENICNFTNREFYCELTRRAYDEGHYTFVQFLVKYGLSCFAEGEDACEEIVSELEKMACLYPECSPAKDRLPAAFIKYVFVQLYVTVGLQRLPRMVIILRAVNICMWKLFADALYPVQEYAKCLRLYYTTMTEPAISMQDVAYFLHLAFHDKNFIRRVLPTFMDIFPDCPRIPSPRSLKCLSRCKVRDHIQKLPTLTAVLSRMDVPLGVKNFLLHLDD